MNSLVSFKITLPSCRFSSRDDASHARWNDADAGAAELDYWFDMLCLAGVCVH